MTIREIFKKIAKENGWPSDRINLAANQAGMPSAVDEEIEARGGMTKAQTEQSLETLMRQLFEDRDRKRN
jgi:hypothetical protein